MIDESLLSIGVEKEQTVGELFAQACVDAAPPRYASFANQLQRIILPKVLSAMPLGLTEKGLNQAGFGDGFPDIGTLTELLQTYLGPVAATVAAGITLYMGYEYYEKRLDSPTLGLIIGVILAAVVGILTYEFASDPVGAFAKIDAILKQVAVVLQQIKSITA